MGDPILNPARFTTTGTVASARLASRAPVAISASLRQSGNRAPIDVLIKDISVGGARIVTHVHLRPNQCVTLTVDIGDDVELDLPARIIHSGESGKEYGCNFGLRFTHLSDVDSGRLSDFVVERLRTRGAATFRRVSRL